MRFVKAAILCFFIAIAGSMLSTAGMFTISSPPSYYTDINESLQSVSSNYTPATGWSSFQAFSIGDWLTSFLTFTTIFLKATALVPILIHDAGFPWSLALPIGVCVQLIYVLGFVEFIGNRRMEE